MSTQTSVSHIKRSNPYYLKSWVWLTVHRTPPLYSSWGDTDRRKMSLWATDDFKDCL